MKKVGDGELEGPMRELEAEKESDLKRKQDDVRLTMREGLG